jgi:hypothetical protein
MQSCVEPMKERRYSEGCHRALVVRRIHVSGELSHRGACRVVLRAFDRIGHGVEPDVMTLDEDRYRLGHDRSESLAASRFYELSIKPNRIESAYRRTSGRESTILEINSCWYCRFRPSLQMDAFDKINPFGRSAWSAVQQEELDLPVADPLRPDLVVGTHVFPLARIGSSEEQS